MGVLKAKVAGNWVPLEYSGGANPQNALGIVAMGALVDGNPLNVPTSSTQITTNIAFTPIVGRRYCIVLEVRAVQSSTTAFLQLWLRDGTTNIYGTAPLQYVPATVYSTLRYEWIIDGDGAAKSYNVSTLASTGVGLYTNSQALFYIEDVGPNAAPALPLPATPQAWIPATLLNSWTQYAGFTPAAYRKIGDIVYLRGFVRYGAANTAVFNLPAGFRPQYQHHLTGASNDAFMLIRVLTNGDVQVNVSGANWNSLDGINFSVSS